MRCLLALLGCQVSPIRRRAVSFFVFACGFLPNELPTPSTAAHSAQERRAYLRAHSDEKVKNADRNGNCLTV
jgi:hypothetical protein